MKNGLTVAKVGSWHFNNKQYKVEGLHVEWSNGNKEWFLNDKFLDKANIEKLKKILSCPLIDLPLFMGDELFSEVIENRFRKEKL